MLVERRAMLAGMLALAASSPLTKAVAEALPEALSDVQKQYYNYLTSIVSSPNIKNPLLCLNNTITPLDADLQTPFFNQQLFRLYSDQTYSSPESSFITPGAMNQSGRFSSLYRDAISIAASQVDQNHPEIAQVVTDLQSRRSDAQKALNDKDAQFNSQWKAVAADRALQPGSRDYTLNYLKWLEDVRYADQMSDYTRDIDRLNAQIMAVRRSKYTPSEMSLINNLDALSEAYDIARPRYAQTELDQISSGQRLSDLELADPHKTPAALYDRSPLILPIADLKAFLTSAGGRGFDSSVESRQISSGSESWTGSGGVSAFGWSVGGGSSGGSSYNRDVQASKSLKISFKNIAEIYIDRGQWFNPGVLQDKKIFELVKSLPQLQYLKFVPVSLFIGRGLTMSLELKNTASSNDWSTQSIQAHGGASFFGFSFGGGGGSSRTSQNFTSNANGATVTFADGDTVIRVLGARVEPFLQLPANAGPLADIAEFQSSIDDLRTGKVTYIDFQKKRVQTQAQ